MAQVICKECKKEFYAKPSWIAKGNGVYCSRKCSSKSRKTGEIVKCFLCQREVYRQAKALKRSERLFCSKTCSITWHNQEFKWQKHGNWKHGGFSYKRLLERSEATTLCSRCGNTNKPVLVAHHLDHDRTNNTLRNLTWLCRNCHHLIHAYPEEEALSLAKRKSYDCFK